MVICTSLTRGQQRLISTHSPAKVFAIATQLLMSGVQSKSANFLRSMSPLPLLYGRNSGSQQPSKQLSSKEKKYVSNVEKALTAFDAVEEWADYISYLGKLQKALQTNPDPEANQWIPLAFDVSRTLSKCLSSKLPSGVHRKALELYSYIFELLGPENTSSSISTWLPGLLPLMSYASISVKPQLIDLFHAHIVTVDAAVLRVIFKSILLSLLPALDDTTSESFDSVIDLIESFKTHLKNNSHFWQCLFLCIITSPDKRPGAMEWCIKKLPSFLPSEAPQDAKTEKEKVLSQISEEARACITQDPGLLVKAFSEALRDENLFVQRGFFDLLISKLQLKSDILQVLVPNEDRELLILSAAGTVLRRDMSLNRRLWGWLLGPETADPASVSTPTKSSTSAEIVNPAQVRSDYFRKHGLQSFTNALFALINGTSNSKPLYLQRIEACKIAVAVMDKWEIGQLIVPKILVPIIRSTKETLDTEESEKFDELIRNASSFFDSVETINIWSDVLKLVKNEEVELILFILKYFRVEEEDMVVTHVPLILLAVLSTYNGDEQWIELIHSLLNVIPQRAFLPIEHADDRYKNLPVLMQDLNGFKEEILQRLDKFYAIDELEMLQAQNGVITETKPFNTADLSAAILSLVTYITSQNLEQRKATSFFLFCEILEELLGKIPKGEVGWTDQTIINAIEMYDPVHFEERDVPIAFGISLSFRFLARQTSGMNLLKLLKTVMNLLWNCLVHPSGKYQVETVKMIWDLEISIDAHYIEAALSSLFLESEQMTRIRAFNGLWTHALSFSESDSILGRPLQLLLDDLKSDNEVDALMVSKWIKATMNSTSINKIFKICCSGLLLKNSFIQSGVFSNEDDEDFALFAYQLQTIVNLLNVDTNSLVPVFKSELCVMDNDAEITILSANHWNVSTYKSLLVTVIRRFLSIDTVHEMSRDEFKHYSTCVKISLNLLEILIDGSESDFADIVMLLTRLCKKVSPNDKEGVSFTFYVKTIAKLMKLASQKHLTVPLFELPTNENPSKYVEVVSDSVLRSHNPLVLSLWVDLISQTAIYYPELIFRSVFDLTTCICNKIERLFSSHAAYIIGNSAIDSELMLNDLDDSITVLINGLQELLDNSHKYLDYSTSGSFSSLGGSMNGKESSFFGSVMQGVFQVEAPDEKSEEQQRRMMILKSLKTAATTCYDVWLWSDENSKVKTKTVPLTPSSPLTSRMNSIARQSSYSSMNKLIDEEKPHFLTFTKTITYNASKLKFRSKRVLESIYTLEPLETLETLISHKRNQSSPEKALAMFKLIHIFDGAKSQKVLPLLINSLVSRVNVVSVEASKRSSLITTLTDKEIASFLVEYMDSLSNDSVEDIWPQLTAFLKDIQTNYAAYKSLFSDLLKFTTIVGVKVFQISFGEQRKVRKDMIEAFTKILGFATNLKTNLLDESTLSAILNPLNILPGSEIGSTDALTSNNGNTSSGTPENTGSVHTTATQNKTISSVPPSVTTREQSPFKDSLQVEKEAVREELCLALKFVIPRIQLIVQETDKVMACLTTVITNAVIPLTKSKTLGNSPVYVLELFKAVAQCPQSAKLKLWKTLCFELLTDAKFFDYELNPEWNGVFLTWVSEDKERLDDLITKLLPYNGTSTLFSWNDSEISTRTLNLKRVSYLLLISPKDAFLNYFSSLQSRVEDMLKNSSNQSLRPYIFLLIRVLVCKFSETHLATLWPTIYTELQLVFQEIWERLYDAKLDIEGGTTSELGLDNAMVLEACKLLDVLLLLKLEEFQLSEWLFISDTTDAVYRNSSVPVLSLVDKISELKIMRSNDAKTDKSVRIALSVAGERFKRPLLSGCTKIGSILELRDFFEKLSIHSYENDYNLRDVVVDSVEQDLFEDLF